MEDHLRSLGFTRSNKPVSSQFFKMLTELGVTVPSDFRTFFEYSPPQRLSLGFRFTPAGSHDEWEGAVVEFMQYPDPESLARARVSFQGAELLPIGVDPGGNYAYLNLRSGAVVDQDYQPGRLSEIASSLGDFVRMLYPIE